MSPVSNPYPGPKVENINTTAVGTDADTAEKTLITYTLPANRLSSDGQVLRITAWGTAADNANNKTMKLYFGATVLRQLGAAAFTDAAWKTDAIVVRTGASSQDAIASEMPNNSVIFMSHTEPAEDNSTDTEIKITGQNAVASVNDIVAQGLMVEFIN